MSHIFAVDMLAEIVKRRAGLEHEQMVALIIEDLERAYPGHIEARQNWMFSLAGGAVGIPLGAAVLNWTSPDQMRAFIGIVLIVFGLYSLARPALPAVKGGAIADSIVGLLSGAFSGSTGLAGIPVIVWASPLLG